MMVTTAGRTRKEVMPSPASLLRAGTTRVRHWPVCRSMIQFRNAVVGEAGLEFRGKPLPKRGLMYTRPFVSEKSIIRDWSPEQEKERARFPRPFGRINNAVQYSIYCANGRPGNDEQSLETTRCHGMVVASPQSLAPCRINRGWES